MGKTWQLPAGGTIPSMLRTRWKVLDLISAPAHLEFIPL